MEVAIGTGINRPGVPLDQVVASIRRRHESGELADDLGPACIALVLFAAAA